MTKLHLPPASVGREGTPNSRQVHDRECFQLTGGNLLPNLDSSQSPTFGLGALLEGMICAAASALASCARVW